MNCAALTMEQARHQQQFQQLLERHRGIVLKVAHSYCRDAHERADLAQEIAAQLWRAFPGYDGTRPFSTWMYRIALNVAISQLREHGRREQWHEPLQERHDASIDSGDPATDQRVHELYRCIDRLDPFNRALLVLYLDECSQRDIAEILGITETNVATRIARLKQRLREEMNP